MDSKLSGNFTLLGVMVGAGGKGFGCLGGCADYTSGLLDGAVARATVHKIVHAERMGTA